ncbi:MAG: hypothetical protein J2P48_24270, partial [Alphaproteobacteria bacterium]|nr:hypothetical protein [Alphaproteobacteria bacterium]
MSTTPRRAVLTKCAPERLLEISLPISELGERSAAIAIRPGTNVAGRAAALARAGETLRKAALAETEMVKPFRPKVRDMSERHPA